MTHPWGDDGPLPERATPAARSDRSSLADAVVTGVAFAVALLLGFAGWFAVVLSMMAFDACAGPGTCSYASGDAVLIGYPIAALVVVSVSLVLAVRRRVGRRAGWPPVVVAVPTVLLLVVVGCSIVSVAATPR